MDGILIVNKPIGFTSHDVINVLRRPLQTKKLGHTGTLDPDASGVLVVGVNKGTKIMKYLNNDEKIYKAKACIGISTDTVDKTGEIIEQKPVSPLENLDQVLNSFMGTYTQTPPMYSAIKYKGKRLYEYARKGIIIDDIPSRDIQIHKIERVSEVTYQDGCAYFEYIVHASKGLYVRTLSYDIGKKLGYPAHNYDLERIQAGRFHIKDSYTIEQIKNQEFKLISLSDALNHLPSINVDDEIKHHIKNGMAISTKKFEKTTLTRIIDTENNLLALYDLHPTEHKMKAENIFYQGDQNGNN